MKRFFIGLLVGLASAAITIGLIMYRRVLLQSSASLKLYTQTRYNKKVKELSEQGALTVEIANQKRKEVKHEVFTEEHNAVLDRFKSNFRTVR